MGTIGLVVTPDFVVGCGCDVGAAFDVGTGVVFEGMPLPLVGCTVVGADGFCLLA